MPSPGHLRPLFAAAGIFLAAAASAAAVFAGSVFAGAPQRVVSISLCTDQLAMLVAAPGQLVSVTYLAVDPGSSPMVEEARAFHINHGFAEEVALLRPDLVLAGRYTTRVTVDMLIRLGHPVEIFEPENSIEDIRTNLRKMGAALGREARAEELIALMDRDLDAIATALPETRPEVAFYYASGYSLGTGTLADAIATRAGLENIAPRLDLGASGVVPLEALILARPGVVVRSAGYRGHSRAQEILNHPALQHFLEPPRRDARSGPEWVCGTPLVTDAIRALARAAGQELRE
ncbi:ABC transporter substrate-binding protein [Pseudogemmobacter humi]|uniref:Corrinoid ABC transporter substrate-binding protein n=1 Tax=Pseudogemmobacter humi TaxID=2483812 RepID=A0A3P5XFB9_9RHOB|nr:ABC transporter substrate-binding protein [Pseudogemmobacter humi]VDC30095.1 corrinoid ABC transporter substrate-binding protein [Pseudogemmobacter humi]